MIPLKSFRLPLLLLSLSLLVFACEEALSPPELLTGGGSQTWRLSARSINGTEDLLNLCDKTFEIQFNSNGSWSWMFTGNECVPEELSGTWSFNTTETVLTVGPETIDPPFEWTVLTLTADSLKVRREEFVDQVKETYVVR